MTRVLLTHTPEMFDGYYGAAALAALTEAVEVVRYTGTPYLKTNELIALAKDCQIILSDRATPGEAALFAALPSLAAFLRCAVDIRTIDVAAASAHGVLVTRATPGFVNAVNEWILGAMIDLARRISQSAIAYRRGEEPVARLGIQLSGATLGIVGLGAIGRQLALTAAQLGMKVLVHDPYVTEVPAYAEAASFSGILTRADFVVSLAVANDSAENLFGESAFAQMKNSAFFINPSRGNLVDEPALIAALESASIAGAALDVGRAPDQKPSMALAQRADVIATPHIGGLTRDAVEHQAFDTVRQVKALIAGEMPDGAVNPEQASRLTVFRR
ncbi:MAG: NAD(P)-dependent oxidoreductase [Burkholderiaceae bacterium]